MAQDDKLTLAEAYYMVAEDLNRNARDQKMIADRLNRYADQICEARIAEQAATPTVSPPVTSPGE